MNKHIVVVSQYYYPENFRINDITREWVKRGYEVSVVTGIPNYPKGRFFKGYGVFRKRKEIVDGIRIIRLPIFPRLNNSIALTLNYLSFVVSGWFWSRLTTLKADFVFNFEVSPMTQALPALWFAKRRNIPSIIYVQDLWPENLQIVGGINNHIIIKMVNKMVDKIYEQATKILVTSNSFKDSIIQRGVDETKIDVWYQYAEEFYKFSKNQYRKENEILKIVFTGNIGEAQGLDILPKVAVLLNNNGYDDKIKFIIVGDGRNKQNLLNEISKSNVESLFEFIESQPATNIPYILSLYDVAFLSFSDNDLFRKTIPAKLQSYMACGMPILAVAEGESERIVIEAKCGLASKPNDIMGAYENILKFYTLNQESIKQMSINSQNYNNTFFSKKNLIDKFDLLVKEIC
jgi:glycosyltransferase involved in cell wall biosynthesis